MPDIYPGRDYVWTPPMGFEDRTDREPPVRVGPSDEEIRKATTYATFIARAEGDRAQVERRLAVLRGVAARALAAREERR